MRLGRNDGVQLEPGGRKLIAEGNARQHREMSKSSIAFHNLRGVTILLVGQNVNYTLQISHYGYVMETGRITLEGTSEMLMNNEFVRRAYLGIAEETPSA